MSQTPNPAWRPNTKTSPAFDITVFNQNYTKSRPLGPYMKARFGWFWTLPAPARFRSARTTHSQPG